MRRSRDVPMLASSSSGPRFTNRWRERRWSPSSEASEEQQGSCELGTHCLSSLTTKFVVARTTM